jgi:hypothetical protein
LINRFMRYRYHVRRARYVAAGGRSATKVLLPGSSRLDATPSQKTCIEPPPSTCRQPLSPQRICNSALLVAVISRFLTEDSVQSVGWHLDGDGAGQLDGRPSRIGLRRGNLMASPS